MRSHPPSPHSGFTLIELSLVLVIIGLIVGGILVGRDLIRTASLRKVITQVTSYKTAVNAFKGKYNALPGDFVGALAMWGSNCPDSDTGSPATDCNGDGNGLILASAVTGVTGYGTENSQVWRHLYLAGLIPFNVLHAGNNQGGQGVPSSIDNAGWAAGNGAWTDLDPVFGRVSNAFMLQGPYSPTAGTVSNNGVLSVANAQAIDAKMDDGLADGGMVRPGWAGNEFSSGTNLCASPNAYPPHVHGTYLTAVTDTHACRLFFFWDQ